MKSVTIELPDLVDITEKEAKTMLAARLFETGKLSLGQAAEVAGYTKRTFMELLSDYDVSLFTYTDEDFEKELINVRDNHR